MIGIRPPLEVAKLLPVRDAMECRLVCRRWSEACGKEEIWLGLGESFTSKRLPGESPRHWFMRCNRIKTTLVNLLPNLICTYNISLHSLRFYPSSLPTTEATYSLFTEDGSLIVTGGGPLTSPSNTVLRVDSNGDHQVIARLLQGRRNHGAALFQTCVYVFGGMQSVLMPTQTAESLNLSTGVQEALPSSHSSRFCFTPITDLEAIYLTGGFAESIIEVFHPVSKLYSVLPIDINIDRDRSISVLKDNHLYIIYAQTALQIDINTHKTTLKPDLFLPPGEVCMSPLLLESTIWLLLDSRPVALQI